jgi:asparagine N-glycosylation enzyme membrane subunit Stt3
MRLTKRSKVNNLNRKEIMLWTIFVILLILWLLGFVGFHVLGAYIHVLLLIALVVLILQLIGGRRSL